jgi:hypothetical protein
MRDELVSGMGNVNSRFFSAGEFGPLFDVNAPKQEDTSQEENRYRHDAGARASRNCADDAIEQRPKDSSEFLT